MAFWKRNPSPVDLISSQALADFGRYEFLGPEQSGVTDPYSLISAMVPLSHPEEGPEYEQVLAELRRHAARGEWEKVGAWKYVREFLSEKPQTLDLIDGGLLAIERMQVTNLAIHLAPIDQPRWEQLTGGPPPNDGFFGPPVFESSFGPTRQYYFDHAIATAAGRSVSRLRSSPGIQPGPVEDAAKAMWDFGLLVYRGPLVVSPDIAFEPNVVRPAAQIADGADHRTFIDRVAEAILDTSSYIYGVWSTLGGARFAEEYLDPAALEAPGYDRLLTTGVELAQPVLGVAMAPELLTQRQRARLAALRPTAG